VTLVKGVGLRNFDLLFVEGWRLAWTRIKRKKKKRRRRRMIKTTMIN